MGSMTSTNGITIKWEPLSGNGETWDNWKNTSLDYVSRRGFEDCP